MSFVLTEEQTMLKDAASDFAQDQLTLSNFRRQRDNGQNGKDLQTWTAMSDMGWAGILVPEEFGGSEFGFVGLGQVLEAVGRQLFPSPLLQTALLGASALTLGGTQTQKETVLPKIAEGKITTALAVDETAHHSPLKTSMSAAAVDGGFQLNGTKVFVAGGHIANLFIVAARTYGVAGDADGLTLFLVPADTDGVAITELDTLDAHGAANLTFDNVIVPASDVLGTIGEGWSILEPILDRACIGLAAEMLGGAQAAFEMTLEYLKTRRQFGQLIGSFQALQHRAAIMFTELEQTRSCVAAALSGLDNGTSNVSQLASLAKARAGDTLHLVTNETIQLHGGIGMTDEHDAGFFIKRARVQEALYGSTSYHKDRYATLRGY